VCKGKLSLCICKPYIRKSAKKGDWIIGMGGKSDPKLKNRLIYVMRVGEVVDGKVYYSRDGEYKDRPDCIYEWDGKDFKRREDAQYHSPEDLKRDLGKPEKGYERAVCLVGDCFAYFGDGKKTNPDIVKIKDIYDKLPHLHQKITGNSANYQRLKTYIDRTLKKFGCGIHSTPTHSDKSENCGKTEDEVMKVCPALAEK